MNKGFASDTQMYAVTLGQAMTGYVVDVEEMENAFTAQRHAFKSKAFVSGPFIFISHLSLSTHIINR